MNDLTQIPDAIEKGDPHAPERLLPMDYLQLRKVAARRLAFLANFPLEQPPPISLSRQLDNSVEAGTNNACDRMNRHANLPHSRQPSFACCSAKQSTSSGRAGYAAATAVRATGGHDRWLAAAHFATLSSQILMKRPSWCRAIVVYLRQFGSRLQLDIQLDALGTLVVTNLNRYSREKTELLMSIRLVFRPCVAVNSMVADD